ncbi:hypothetical protein SS50377_27576 [Spironucleus salmonicida]|uniref:Uncharacterized protein n=1 Tax=Spironucleus salmonicida TaxID=348837 RepID=V6LPN1_9EUKA|nr:hypothetical protein SS50377_27576 [Spironucleus salmonicida]|eukprot:EST46647.1 hypothetical protein SS50377_13450 [Spironucleus salmonicida]
MSDIEKKIDDLTIIAKNASNKQDKDLLVQVMRQLVDVRAVLQQAQIKENELMESNELLTKEVTQLKETILNREYQITHLSRNLKTYMEKDEVK